MAPIWPTCSRTLSISVPSRRTLGFKSEEGGSCSQKIQMFPVHCPLIFLIVQVILKGKLSIVMTASLLFIPVRRSFTNGKDVVLMKYSATTAGCRCNLNWLTIPVLNSSLSGSMFDKSPLMYLKSSMKPWRPSISHWRNWSIGVMRWRKHNQVNICSEFVDLWPLFVIDSLITPNQDLTRCTEIWAWRLILTLRSPRCGIKGSPVIYLYLPLLLFFGNYSLPCLACFYGSKGDYLNSKSLYGKSYRIRVLWWCRWMLVCDQRIGRFSNIDFKGLQNWIWKSMLFARKCWCHQ